MCGNADEGSLEVRQGVKQESTICRSGTWEDCEIGSSLGVATRSKNGRRETWQGPRRTTNELALGSRVSP